MKSSGSRLIASFIALILVVSAVCIYAFKSQPAPTTTQTVIRSNSATNNTPAPVDQTSQNTIPTTVPATIPTETTTTTSSKYRNGTYKATGSYDTPEGQESVDVSLTLENGIVTDATVTANAFGGRSLRYQQMFISGYKTSVVGKDIDTISLGRISGSSLTPIGFNNALAEIKTQAKA